MNREEIVSRINVLIVKYKEKKEELDERISEFEKLRTNRKVKKYLELGGLISVINRDMKEIIEEVAALEKRYKEEE